MPSGSLTQPCGAVVEEAALAVRDIVGNESLKSASRINEAIIIFLGSMSKMRELMEKGVVIEDTFNTVSPLTNLATNVISNVPPFIRNDWTQNGTVA